jgi:homogentisate 1,2-dioxygenase
MPFYHQLGNIPHKRHILHEKPGGGMYYEQLFGTEGFHGMSSLLYHVHRPTMIKSISEPVFAGPSAAVDFNITPMMLKGWDVKPTSDFLESRTYMLFNNDLNIALAAPQKSLTGYFYKNADADEMLFIHQGSGVLRTLLGNITFSYGDYLIIPRGMIYQIDFTTTENRLFIVESNSPIVTPKRYRNNFGQLLEHSPFCERDIRRPQQLETHDTKGEFILKVRKQQHMHTLVYASHPFDVIGWDGYNYPYAFSIHDFEPITGRIHQPPPVHQTFEAHNFVVCSFCPRLYDYHPKSVPAPYNHSNIDSDEVLYYVDGDFMSRNHVEKGYISLHPGGIPHGPHPGAAERSIGQKETAELAVMVDTFRPLKVTREALQLNDDTYKTSWLES